MTFLKNNFNYSNLTTREKALIIILIFSCLVLTYLLSIGIFIYMVSPEFTGKAIHIFFKKVAIIYNNYALNLPIQAINQGYAKTFSVAVLIALIINIALCIAAYFAQVTLARKKNLHGSAKFSSLSEIKKNKLLSDKGIIVGKYNGKLLKFGGAEFASIGAPTRSGKGVSIVIPNLLEWENSAVILDVKQECFEITSKYRQDKLKNKVFLFDPFSYKTHRYNPLGYLDFNSPDIELQIQSLANSLYPLTGGKDFFILQAQSIFVAITYLFGKLSEENLLANNRFNLTNLAGALQGVELDLDDDGTFTKLTLKETVETANRMDLLSNTIYSKFLSFFEQAEAKDQFAGVKSSYETPLKVFQDSLFEKATETNDFDFRDLRKEKITIYIGITPENIETARPILNLFFTQIIYENIKQGLPDTNPDLKHNVLMLMDEFTSIGYMEQYQTAVAYMAGYWLRSLIIYQNKTQLSENPPLGYGDKGSETLLENHACQVYFRPKQSTTAEEISKRIGNITTSSNNKSFSSKDMINVSRSVNQTSRALILPQEIMELSDKEQIILCNSAKIKCEKAFFYNDNYFINKLKSVSPYLSSIQGIPSENELKTAYVKGETSITIKSLNNENQSFFPTF